MVHSYSLIFVSMQWELSINVYRYTVRKTNSIFLFHPTVPNYDSNDKFYKYTAPVLCLKWFLEAVIYFYEKNELFNAIFCKLA